MRIRVAEEPVRQNVELFLEILRQEQLKGTVTALPNEKVFKAWLNRQTGQLFFDTLAKEKEFYKQREWKPVAISYLYDPQDEEIFFLVEEEESKKKGFGYGDLTDQSFRVLKLTFHVLNEMASRLKGPSNLETKMMVILKAQVEAPEAHTDRNILIDAWHAADRLEAEVLLWNKPEGTYLFRKDNFTGILEVHLRKEHGKELKCFTLTYSCVNRKFCDLTLVHIDCCWQVYNDDPTLSQTKFQDLKAFLSSMSPALKFPLYH